MLTALPVLVISGVQTASTLVLVPLVLPRYVQVAYVLVPVSLATIIWVLDALVLPVLIASVAFVTS